jgi:beta-carotene 3-hydroxylase
MAWFTHEFVMHGFLWKVHLDHHTPSKDKFLKKNDLFFLIYEMPLWLCIVLSSMFASWRIRYVGFGILAYEIAYFLIHEVFTHQRFKWFRNNNNNNNVYLKSIRRADKTHHKHRNKEQVECFEMLIIP